MAEEAPIGRGGEMQEQLATMRGQVLELYQEVRTLRAALLPQSNADSRTSGHVLARSIVDMVNPRLGRYGASAACRMAVSIVVLQGLMLGCVMLYFRQAVQRSPQLMDYTDVLHIMDEGDGTKAVCGTFGKEALTLPESLRDAKCNDSAANLSVWDPLGKTSTSMEAWCLRPAEHRQYEDFYDKLAARYLPRSGPRRFQSLASQLPERYVFRSHFVSKAPGFIGAAVVNNTVYFSPFVAKEEDYIRIGIFDTVAHTFHLHPTRQKGGQGNYKFGGAAAVGNVVVFAPYHASGIGVFNAATRSFQLIHISKHEVDAPYKFAGAAAVGDTVYFAPFWADCVGMFKVTNQVFRCHPIDFRGAGKFSFATAIGDTVYFSPFETRAVGIFHTANQTLRLHDIGDQISEGMFGMFGGAATVGDTVYFAPWAMDGIGVFNSTTQTFRIHRLALQAFQFHQFNPAFTGAVAVGDTVFFSPYAADGIGVFNATAQTFHLHSVRDQLSTTNGLFGDAVAVGKSVYFAPVGAPSVGMFERRFTGYEWSDEDREGLARIRDIVAERTSPCVMRGRSCSDYTCFGGGEAGCDQDYVCPEPTVNVMIVTRHSWLNSLLGASSQTSYYEILATGLLLGLYLSYSWCYVSRDLPPGYLQVVLESASATELQRQRERQ